MNTSRLSPLLVTLALLLLSGCSSQTYSIRQLGHPAFEPVVGKETAFERADPKQRQGLDAFTRDVEDDGDHSFLISFWPAGTEGKIGLEVRARAKGKLPLERLAAAVFAVSRQDSSTFSVTGELPDPNASIAFSAKSKVDEDGNTILTLIFDRKAIPEEAEWLAIPTLTQFADGWIHIKYYETTIPEVTKLPTKEEVEQMIKAREAQAKGDEPAPKEEAAEPTASEPVKDEPAQAPDR